MDDMDLPDGNYSDLYMGTGLEDRSDIYTEEQEQDC